jgi:ubiquinone/menaquinone biosynthesis C-methylase UbiE
MSALNIWIKRKDYPNYHLYLAEQEYRLVKKVIADILKPHANPSAKLLDLACWDGESTAYYGQRLGITQLFGVDVFPDKIEAAKKKSVNVKYCNLESEQLPFDDHFFDIVIANQIFEHLKQIYRPLSEIHRVLKPNGILLFSVPNLASFHSRILLLFGMQPGSIKIFDAHVRGFAPRALKEFLTFNNLFSVIKFTGSGYYPFPPLISIPLSKPFKGSGVFQIFALNKNDKSGETWQENLVRRNLQSNFN